MDLVTPRLLGPDGAAESMATLEEEWQVILHQIARSPQPVGLEKLGKLLVPEGTWRVDYVKLFAEVADGLLSRGVVLATGPTWPTGQERYKNLTLSVPEAHLAFLPPYPVRTRPLDQPPAPGTALPGLRRVLQQALGGGPETFLECCI
ncbi:MAG: hypothetical protein HY319_15645 [Armatimonadetes bacterium]|nr:hypothetical protein [Armatimonadota bacterium]